VPIGPRPALFGYETTVLQNRIPIIALERYPCLAQTAEDDIKKAGQDIKEAGKATANAAKNAGKATAKTTKTAGKKN
jgi:hypothetical protein